MIMIDGLCACFGLTDFTVQKKTDYTIIFTELLYVYKPGIKIDRLLDGMILYTLPPRRCVTAEL